MPIARLTSVLASALLAATLAWCAWPGSALAAAKAPPRRAVKAASHAGKQGNFGKSKNKRPKPAPRHPPVEVVRAPLGQLQPIYDPGGRALEPWHAALARVLEHKATARIAFYGASHTAADLWTGELRRRLQDRYGDGGHGFALPTRFNPGYRHQDLVVESSKGWQVLRHRRDDGAAIGSYGLAGMVMLSADPTEWAEVRTTQDNPHGRRYDRLQVWVAPQPGGGHWWLDLDGQRHVLDGSQAAARLKNWDLADTGHQLRLQPAGDGPVGLFGIVMERSAGGVVIDQLGIPGMRAEIHLHWQEQVWAEQLARRAPDLVVLAYGTNDVGDPQSPADYAAEWQRVLQRVRTAAPQAACVIVGPSDRLAKDAHGHWQPFARTPEVIDVQKRVAAQVGCGHWDAVAVMGGQGSMDRWRRAGLAARDGVHLNRAGYTRLAELFDAALHSGVAKVVSVPGRSP